MTWFFIILAVLAFIIWSFNKDKKEILDSRELKLGTMQNRYSILVNAFAKPNFSRIVEEKKDSITIKNEFNNNSIIVNILEFYDLIVVEYVRRIKALEIERKRWQFPLKTNHKLILDRIKSEIDFEFSLKSICPFIGCAYFTDCIREIDLNTDEVGTGFITVTFFKISENEIKINCHEDDDSDGEVLSWVFLKKENDNFLFEDELNNIWTLNNKAFSVDLSGENKKIIYEFLEH